MNDSSHSKAKSAGIGCASALGALVGWFIVSTLLFRFVWGWVVPDVLPGAVEQGLIAESLSWTASAKLGIPIGILGGMIGLNKMSDR